jgi:hypothetical protein
MEKREGGFIKIHRRIMSWPLYRYMSGEQRIVVIHLVLLANWQPGDFWYAGHKVSIGRGELAHSLQAIAADAGVSVKVVRTAICRLKSDGFLTERYPLMSGRGPRIITICNYDQYQTLDEIKGTKKARTGHARGTHGALIEEGEEREEVNTSGEACASPPVPPSASPFVTWLAATYPDIRDPVAFEGAQIAANPRVNLLVEARRAYAWETANPSQKKHNHGRFLNTWFAKQQDRSVGHAPLREANAPPPLPRVS